METPKNRIIVQKTKGPAKVIHDYLTRKDAITAFYDLCDKKQCGYGRPVFKKVNGIKAQVGMQSIGQEYLISLYI